MLQALNLRTGAPLLPDHRDLPAGRPGMAGTSVLVPGGPFVLGVDAANEPYSLDNERPAHVVDVPAFRIGRVPVTNGEWQHFIDDGGYTEPRWWSTRGWQHRLSAGLTAPQFWSSDGANAHPVRPHRRHSRRRAGTARQLLRGRGLRGLGRCPAAHRDGMGEGLRVGSGDQHPASLPMGSGGAVGGSTSTWVAPRCVRHRSGAYPAGASAYGVEQMLGDVWEWTSSPLRPWPGFVPMIYERYSQPFFDGDYRVLRGGSWAVESAILRPSFRNWDHPYRRQIFSGVRLAWDVPDAGTRLMCRHLGWLGADVTVSSLVLDPPYGLRVQSYAPRRQKHGLMNADGWGVGFFDDGKCRGAGVARRRYGATRRSTRSRRRCAATAWWPRSARPPSACRSKSAPPRHSPTANGCCRTTVLSTAPCCR